MCVVKSYQKMFFCPIMLLLILVLQIFNGKIRVYLMNYTPFFLYFFQQQTLVAVLNMVVISCLIKNTTIIWTFEIVSYAFITASTELFVGSVGSFPDDFPFFQIYTGSFTETKPGLEGMTGSPDLLTIHHSVMLQQKTCSVSSSQHKLLCNWFFSHFSKMPKRFGIRHWSPLKIQVAFTYRCFSVSERGVPLCVCTHFT